MDTRKLAVLAADAWSARHGCPALVYDRPDDLDRHNPAVDLLGRDRRGEVRLVLEHTLVESFLDQRTSQIAAIRMFEPLERELRGRLPSPGHYRLSLAPPEVLGLKREGERIREWVRQWIRGTAPTLSIGAPHTTPRHFATVAIPDTKLVISLARFPRRDGDVDLVFEAPANIDVVLAPSLDRALNAKCPKLAAAKSASPGAVSLLLLEILDIALGNLFDFDAVVQARLAQPLADPPDHLWLVDTTDVPPSVMISKAGECLGDAIGERFLPSLLRLAEADR